MVMSKITKSVATKITTKFDNLAEAMFGGQLEKAQFLLYANVSKRSTGVAGRRTEGIGSDAKNGVVRPNNGDVMNFFINPHTIQVVKEAQLKEGGYQPGDRMRRSSRTPIRCA